MPPTTASANVYLQGNSDTIQASTDEQSAISPTGRRELAIVHGVTGLRDCFLHQDFSGSPDFEIINVERGKGQPHRSQQRQAHRVVKGVRSYRVVPHRRNKVVTVVV